MEGFHSGFVTLIGRPNVGKSTLMNRLIGQKIAITSEKPQTTRNRIETVYTDERGQIVFLDTPGITHAKNKLGDYMITAAEATLKEVDLILWLAEPAAFFGEGEAFVREKLKGVKTPVYLVINKTDTVGPDSLKACEETFLKEFPFKKVIRVSALSGENVDGLMTAIFEALPEGPQYFDEDTLTDQPMRQIAAELIREKALRNLSDEVPHGIAVEIERMAERPDGLFDVDASIVCEKESHKGIVIGKKGAMLKKIGTEARLEIEALMDARINLKLWVKVRRDWRNDMSQLRGFGYTVKK